MSQVDPITAEAFVLEVRRLGGFETIDEANSFVTDAEILSRGNANLRKVYLALVRARGANYYRKTVDFSTVAQQAEYDFDVIVPGGKVLEVVSLSRQVGTVWEPLLNFEEAERNDYDDWPSGLVYGTPVRFALRPDGLEFQPIPATVETIRMAYVPQFTPMVLGDATTSFDGIAGFHEWAIWETVAELQAKDMVDPSVAFGKARWWEEEVASMGRQRLAGMPKRVSRVRQLHRGWW